MSQNFDLGISFDFYNKKQEDLVDFFLIKFSTFHEIKNKGYFINLRHGSLHINVIYKHCKLGASKYIIRRVIIVQKKI